MIQKYECNVNLVLSVKLFLQIHQTVTQSFQV